MSEDKKKVEKKVEEKVEDNLTQEELNAKMEEHAKAIDATIEKANEEAKTAMSDEVKKVSQETKDELQTHLDEYKELQEKQQEQLNNIQTAQGRLKDGPIVKSFQQEFKDALDNSEQFKAFASKNATGATIEMKDIQLFGKAGDMTTGNTFTGEVIPPTRVPGFVFDPDRDTHVRSFLSVATTNSDSVRYVEETAIDDGTATAAEGSALPQSDVDLTAKTKTVEKIGTFLTVTDEMMNDTEGLTSYLTGRFGKKVRVAEDNQILYGDSTGSNLTGISLDSTSYVDTLADTNVNRFDVIMSAITQARVDEYTANVVLIHPNDWNKMALTKDTQGNYLVPNIFSGAMIIVGGVPVVANTAVTDGDFFVGDFRLGATLWDRQTPVIEFSNSHSTNFTSNLTTIRIFERITLTIFRKKAFIFGDFPTALAEGTS